MNRFCALFAMLALAIVPVRADDSLSDTAGGPSHDLSVWGWRNHHQPKVIEVEGRKAWTCPEVGNTDHQLHFTIAGDDFKDGGHPSVVFTIDYFDEGTGRVDLEYDSLVDDPATGSAKKGGSIVLTDSKTWKTATIAVTDARFEDRCDNNTDFRFTVPQGSQIAINKVTITVGTEPPSVAYHHAPRGKILLGDFNQSKIFPGTTRRLVVYVPQQYDPAKPACVYVLQDGWDKHVTNMMNHLIDQKKMPVTIGIFITPGSLPPPTPQSKPRPNRGFEYDSLGRAYASFLLDEVIPYVKQTYSLNLSDNPDDRCIGGGSSGGICAFNVAWERPDAFHRVFCVSGSFSAFRGGDILPELVRECEPKPIRVYMHVGTDDMDNSGGSWYLANQEMARSLQFAGYDYQYQFNNGHHMAMNHEDFPAAMEWLWRDYPAPIKPGVLPIANGTAPLPPNVGPARIQSILVPGQTWQEVGEGYQDARGLTVDPAGDIFFCDAATNKIYKVGADGKPVVFAADAQGVNALATDAKGNLYGVSEKSGNVLAFDAQGAGKILASGITGHDLTAVRDGSLYVTNSGPAGAGQSEVWHVSPTGDKTKVDTGLLGATGVTTSADGYELFVADGRSHWVYAYVLNLDGTLIDKQQFYWLHEPDDEDDAGAEGLTMDQAGIIYVATRMGVQMSGIQGHTQGYMPSPGGRITSLCFGGPQFSDLYIACGDKVYKRTLKSKGQYVFDPPVLYPQGGGL